jgi:putative hemolysin
MRCIAFLVYAAFFALVACSPPAPPKPSEGAAQQAKMDVATKAYSGCIAEGAKAVDVADEAAGTIANRVVVACKAQRNALMADVIAFHQIGHPKFSIDQSKAVAEASIATIEDELRQQTVVAIVQRQTAGT